VKGTTCY